MAVLVDSSVWINASNPNRSEALALKRLIKKNELIYYTRMIQVEVCQGARTEKLFHEIWEYFLGFDLLDIQTSHWGKSAWNYFRCRRLGKTISTVDCLIATLSKEYGVPLWTSDQIFEKIQPIIGFELYSAP